MAKLSATQKKAFDAACAAAAPKQAKPGQSAAPTADCPDPMPGTQQEHECDISLTGKLRMCCPCLMSRTFVIDLNPSDLASMKAAVGTTAQAYEAGGWIVLGHSFADVGAGWVLFLTIGWYQ